MYTGDRNIWDVCPDCDETALGGMFEPNIGNGKCRHCEGDGTDHTPITSEIVEMITGDEGTCNYCHGTGQCQTCGGEGRVKLDSYNENSEDADTDENDEEKEYTEQDEDDDDDYDNNNYSSDNYKPNTYTSTSSYSNKNINDSNWLIALFVVVCNVFGQVLTYGIYQKRILLYGDNGFEMFGYILLIIVSLVFFTIVGIGLGYLFRYINYKR